MCEGLLSSCPNPDRKSNYRNQYNNRYKDARNFICQFLNRSFRGLTLLNLGYDTCKKRIRTNFFSNKLKAAPLIYSSGKDLIASRLLRRQGLTSNTALIDKRATCYEFSIYCYLFTRTNEQVITNFNLNNWYFPITRFCY